MKDNPLIQDEKEDINKLFVRSLMSNLYKKNPAVYTLKRARGRLTDFDDINTYLSFVSVSGGNYAKEKEDIYYLVACLFYSTERFRGEISPENLKRIKVEDLLNRLYWNSSNSTRAQIARLLGSNYDKNGAFNSLFTRLFNRAAKEYLRSNETIDYAGLIKDLSFWNATGYISRRKWGERIMSYDLDEKGEEKL